MKLSLPYLQTFSNQSIGSTNTSFNDRETISIGLNLLGELVVAIVHGVTYLTKSLPDNNNFFSRSFQVVGSTARLSHYIRRIVCLIRKTIDQWQSCHLLARCWRRLYSSNSMIIFLGIVSFIRIYMDIGITDLPKQLYYKCMIGGQEPLGAAGLVEWFY